MIDSDPIALSTWLAKHLNDFKLAYLHVMRADSFGIQRNDVLTPIRKHYHGTIISNMGYSKDEANAVIAEGKADAIAFGVPFQANSDLPARLQAGAELNQADPATFYSPGPKGYTDYPAMG